MLIHETIYMNLQRIILSKTSQSSIGYILYDSVYVISQNVKITGVENRLVVVRSQGLGKWKEVNLGAKKETGGDFVVIEMFSLLNIPLSIS